MNYLSICSGIEAASVAWHDIPGWKPVGFSEIEPFPCAVLKHRFPDVPNFGDMTKYKQWKINEPIDLLVGGTPCQAFSVAGLRKGLADPRGNLTLTFLGMVEHFRPKWVLWENVPGVLSEKSGAFGSFLGGLAELGYGWAYRILDAQFFGVAQRRRRVFVVASPGGWQRAASVLFEPESVRGDSAPSREAGERTAEGTSVCPQESCVGAIDCRIPAQRAQNAQAGHYIAWPCEIAPTLNAAFGDKQGLEDQHALNGGGYSFPPPISQCLNAGAMGRSDAETETLIPCTK